MTTRLPVPPAGKVLILRDKPKELSGAIIDPKYNPPDQPSTGKIANISVLENDKSRIGLRVLFGKYAGTTVPRDIYGDKENEYIVLRDEDILLTL